MSAEGYLMRYEREQDRSALLAEEKNQLAKEQLMDALQIDSIARRDFIEWLCDDPQDFIREMNSPGERTHKEVIYNWMSRYADMMVADLGWRKVSQAFHLGLD